MDKATGLRKDNYRISSIDTLRGLIMIIMALDHVRDFFSYHAFRPTDLSQTSVALFFTRWITHLCAPTFVFLSGISIFLYAKKIGDLKKTSVFLLTRGLWLIVVEIVLISFIITQGYQLTLLEVIWAIACSMILLAGLIWVPRSIQLTIALLMIFGHDALPPVGKVSSENMVFAILHNSPFFIPRPPVLVAYTIIPWVGVMLLGYVLGSMFTKEQKHRDKIFLVIGIFSLILFTVLRYLNIYGEPMPWSSQPRGAVFTVLSFLNVSKSPPSLLFLLVTLGISSILLVALGRLPVKLKNILSVYGRVPFFYFVLHLALISFTAYLWTSLAFGHAINLSFVSPKEWPAAYTPNLVRAYGIWVALVLVLYYPCKWFGKFKSSRKAWWVSYL